MGVNGIRRSRFAVGLIGGIVAGVMLLAAMAFVAQSITKSTGQTAQQTKRSAGASQQIAEATKQTAENTKGIAETTERISLSLEAIRRELSAAAKHDGIIDTPSVPSDFYHNARQYEQRGDYPAMPEKDPGGRGAFHAPQIITYLQPLQA